MSGPNPLGSTWRYDIQAEQQLQRVQLRMFKRASSRQLHNLSHDTLLQIACTAEELVVQEPSCHVQSPYRLAGIIRLSRPQQRNERTHSRASCPVPEMPSACPRPISQLSELDMSFVPRQLGSAVYPESKDRGATCRLKPSERCRDSMCVSVIAGGDDRSCSRIQSSRVAGMVFD
jgi:hypothetical protein